MRSPYDAVCLLNADTIVTGDFLTPCTAVLAERGDVGIIGPTVLEARTPDIIQCEGGEIVRWRLGFNYLRAGEVYTIKEDVVDVGYVLGAAMIIRREIIETVGTFDEDYTPAYVEEADLCYRARLAGYRCVVHRGASIQHIGGSSAAGKSKTYTRVALRRLYFGTKFLPWPVFMVAGSYVLLQLVLAKLRAAGSSEANGPASIRTDV
jgi:GT2 family glycosyltransferase